MLNKEVEGKVIEVIQHRVRRTSTSASGTKRTRTVTKYCLRYTYNVDGKDYTKITSFTYAYGTSNVGDVFFVKVNPDKPYCSYSKDDNGAFVAVAILLFMSISVGAFIPLILQGG